MNRLIVSRILLISTALGVSFAQDGPESVIRGTKQFKKTVLVSGLANPWEVTWGPDNMLWVTERTGKRITRINPRDGTRRVAITIAEVSAPGSQDGLLGMALHPQLLRGAGNDTVYVGYTYVDKAKGANPMVSDPGSPYRYLYGKIVRLHYDKASGTLSQPLDLIKGLPVGDDHVSGRLKFGPDNKLYYTVGDEGHNQASNACLPIEAQRLPTRNEIEAKNYAAYVGKSLRLNLDGSIPADNPKLGGFISHVYTYGHRNMQGIDFAPDGTLYASEQGPKTDDEVNILKAGSNYGWPNVAGLKDGKAYEYARWADSTVPCAQLTYDYAGIPPSVPRDAESTFTKPFVEPIATMFTVPNDYNFHDPVCNGVDFICWPTVAASSIEYYESRGTGIPGWEKVLLITTLKRGSLYVLPLSADGQKAGGHMFRYFQSENRYRDTAVNPDGKTIYIATDSGGLAELLKGGGSTSEMQNPGAILAFTYAGEDGVSSANPAGMVSASEQEGKAGVARGRVSDGVLPRFTAVQSASGKAAYNSHCAVCHGNTLINGTFGPPLAGEYFRKKWVGQNVRAFYDHARTMPPSAPASLPNATYANIVAYVLELNGFKPGTAPLPAGGGALDAMKIR